MIGMPSPLQPAVIADTRTLQERRSGDCSAPAAGYLALSAEFQPGALSVPDDPDGALAVEQHALDRQPGFDPEVVP